MHALYTVFLPDYNRQWILQSSFFLCPQGPINSFIFWLVITSIGSINKHLDVRKNLTCPPTLSYDKGIAYS